MPSPTTNTALTVAAGMTGIGVLAWQTMFPWIKYDLQLMRMGGKLANALNDVTTSFVIDKFEALVDSQPKKTMIIFEDCLYTYESVEQQSNKVANMMRQQGLKYGDTVALLSHNDPAFIWTFLGLQKLGVSVALINYNLRAKQLSYLILNVESKALIVGAGKDLQDAVSAVLDDLHGLPVLVQGLAPDETAPQGMQDFDAMMMTVLPVRPHHSLRSEMTPDSVSAYVFTSGTTGLPKPAYIKQSKANAFVAVMTVIDVTAEDVIYTVLPLYHGAAMCVGVFGLFLKGNTMLLRRKFSASQFWSDCRKFNVTIIQYIGELFRYLLAQPKDKLDTVHKVRVAFGNGLRKDIFKKVLERYKIPQICEFFAATESVGGLFNMANKPGAVGRLSPFLNRLDPNPSALVKCDYATAMPVRDKNGRCIEVKTGEPGLLICKVPDKLLVNGDLTVYKSSKEANEKKLVRNAFKEGDIYFNYGDMLYMDSDYFVYFHDRIGDTFRWKGENVSTTEVANVLTIPDFIIDANIYGVTVPGHDGRAGMAALTLSEGERMTTERLKEVYKVCQDGLPSYARPLFLRILPESLMTGTFKQRKVELVADGYDITKVKDDLYYYNSKEETYSPLTPEAHASLLQSKL